MNNKQQLKKLVSTIYNRHQLAVIYTEPKHLEYSLGFEAVVETPSVGSWRNRLLFAGVDCPYKMLDTVVNGMELIQRQLPLAEVF